MRIPSEDVGDDDSLRGEGELADVRDDGGVSPRVLGVHAVAAVCEEDEVEALVKPDVAAVTVQQSLATLLPRV